MLSSASVNDMDTLLGNPSAYVSRSPLPQELTASQNFSLRVDNLQLPDHPDHLAYADVIKKRVLKHLLCR